MSKKENLKNLLQSNQDAVKKLMDDVTEEESVNRFNQPVCHIRWHTGHILFYADMVAILLGSKSELSEEWGTLFRGGNEINDDASVYPAMAEIRDKLYATYDRMNKALNDIEPGILDEEKELYPGWTGNPMDGILMLCSHELYHAGQITMLRKMLGRERSFG